MTSVHITQALTKITRRNVKQVNTLDLKDFIKILDGYNIFDEDHRQGLVIGRFQEVRHAVSLA